MRLFSDELEVCQRYWEKSYDYGTAPGTASSANGLILGLAASANYCAMPVGFRRRKRFVPTVTLYSYNGTSGVMAALATNGDTAAASAASIGEAGFGYVSSSGLTAGAGYHGHFVANARL
jgi:hypothetical protein